MNREERLRIEALSLWSELTAEDPPADMSAADLLEAAVRLRTVTGYDRLHSPYLRDTHITRPR